MSGGSMEYLYQKVRDAEFRVDTVERLALKQHLNKLAVLLKEVEWNDSGDTDTDDSKSIREFLGSKMILREIISEGEKLLESLKNEIKIAKEIANE